MIEYVPNGGARGAGCLVPAGVVDDLNGGPKHNKPTVCVLSTTSRLGVTVIDKVSGKPRWSKSIGADLPEYKTSSNIYDISLLTYTHTQNNDFMTL